MGAVKNNRNGAWEETGNKREKRERRRLEKEGSEIEN